MLIILEIMPINQYLLWTTTKNINKSNLVKLSMVQALVELDENTNRVLNIVKAKFGLRDKGEAIQFVVTEYIDSEDEPELRPEFINEIHKIKKQKSIKVADFAKRYGLTGKAR